jgi:hypothetical protein
VIEVTDLRFCKRLAEDRHAVLPLLIADDRKPVDVGEVPDGEPGVLPRRADLPAVEVDNVEQHAQLSVLRDAGAKFMNRADSD